VFRSDMFICRTLILGTGKRASNLQRMIKNEAVLPAHKVIAKLQMVDNPARKEPLKAVEDGVAVMDASGDTLTDIVRSLDIHLVVIGFDDMKVASKYYQQLKRIRFDGVEVLTPLNVAEIYSGTISLDMISEQILMDLSMESGLPIVRRTKRVFDVIVSSAACIVLSPIALLISVLIKLSAPRSPIFYTQLRTGRYGSVFRIFKFRTMHNDAEHTTGPVWSSDNDTRITRMGKLMRRFRFDEIPQFINVLKNDMSIVGPRPERPEFIGKLSTKIPYYNERASVMPGLTGWAQIRHAYGNSIEDGARKLGYDLYYIKHLSLSLDLQIILRTLRIVVFGKERST